jgi:hypothetical protein
MSYTIYYMSEQVKILMSIHLYHEDFFNDFSEYIDRVVAVFPDCKLFFTIKEGSKFIDTILKRYNNAIVIDIENKGGDFNSFLETVKYIRRNNLDIDYLIKIHTKKSDPTWLRELIEPIVDPSNLINLKKYLTKNNVGYIAAQKHILPKEYDYDFPQNIEMTQRILDKFDYLKDKTWIDFHGGGTFWMNNHVLRECLRDDVIEYYQTNFIKGKPPCNLTDKHMFVEYSWERLLTGVFFYDKMNILINENKLHARYSDCGHLPANFILHKPSLKLFI